MTRSKDHIHPIFGDFVVTRARFRWLHRPYLPGLAQRIRILAQLMSFLEQKYPKGGAMVVAEFLMLWNSILEHPLAAPPAMEWG